MVELSLGLLGIGGRNLRDAGGCLEICPLPIRCERRSQFPYVERMLANARIPPFQQGVQGQFDRWRLQRDEGSHFDHGQGRGDRGFVRMPAVQSKLPVPNSQDDENEDGCCGGREAPDPEGPERTGARWSRRIGHPLANARAQPPDLAARHFRQLRLFDRILEHAALGAAFDMSLYRRLEVFG